MLVIIYTKGVFEALSFYISKLMVTPRFSKIEYSSDFDILWPCDFFEYFYDFTSLVSIGVG